MPDVSSELHQKLLAAANALLDESSGSDPIKLMNVCERAGVSKATMYRDKEFIAEWQDMRRVRRASAPQLLESENARLQDALKEQYEVINALKAEISVARSVIASQAYSRLKALK